MRADVDGVLGRSPFASDVRLPGMLHCRLVRSEVPHGRLVRVGTGAARRVGGIHAVVTGDDLRQRADMQTRFGPVLHDQPMLAVDVVRYVGEPVATVVAESSDAADEAAAAVEVDVEPLGAVFDVRSALEEGAPRLFDLAPEVDPSFVDVAVHGDVTRNVCSRFRVVRGDAARALERADHVFEHRFSSPPAQHVPLETHACVAVWQGRGLLTVYSGTQTPFILRAQLANLFGIPQSRVRVVVPPMGGGFGAKAYPTIEPVVAAMALLTSRPVRLHLTREEEFVTVTKHAMEVTLRTGVSRDGVLVARHAVGHYNAGAYAGISPRKIIFGAYGINGPYAVPDALHEMYAVYTNLPPAGPYRGFAINQCAWAYESQMDIIAGSLGIDPYDLRMRNLLQDGDAFCTGEVLHGLHFTELLDRVAGASGYRTRRRSDDGDVARGVGLSCVIEGTITPSTSTAMVKLDADGSVSVVTGSVEMGQGSQRALCAIAAEALGVDADVVTAAEVDTDLSPYDQQTTASRTVSTMGRAVEMACDELRAQLVALGAPMLDTSLEVVAEGGRVRVEADPGRSLGYAEVVRRSGLGNLLGRGALRTKGGLDPETGQGIGSEHWHQSAAAAEVEVDRRTGRVRVVSYRGAVFAGKVVDPVGAALQCEGGLSFGVGNALMEEMLFDDGQLVNGSLADYMLPSLADLPAERTFDVVAEGGPDAAPHGLGEPLLPPVAPAISNAVFDAVGVRIHDLPLTAERVLRALRAQDAGSGEPGRREPG